MTSAAIFVISRSVALTTDHPGVKPSIFSCRRKADPGVQRSEKRIPKKTVLNGPKRIGVPVIIPLMRLKHEHEK